MAYKDTREYLQQVEAIGELAHIKGAHWDLEANAACSLTSKMVLFDDFPGYPSGFRVLGSYSGKESRKRFEIMSGWKSNAENTVEYIRDWMGRLRQYEPVPPKIVSDGPILENVLTGDDVDLLRFPVPRRHTRDGGRYIGTGHTVITRDPDTGRINLGTYRMQVHDRNTTGMHASEGKDGRTILEKYHSRGQACPMVAVVGLDEGLFFSSTFHVNHADGNGELDFAGWLKGQSEELVTGRYTGIPFPANAEIALEGEVRPGVVRMEGPFSEWTGYSMVKEIPVFEVKAIYHRNNPILSCSLNKGFNPKNAIKPNPYNSGLVWDQMEKAGIRGIQGVSYYNRRLVVVSIENQYSGHAMQALSIASQCNAAAYGNTYAIVVDANIDPTNLQEVMWQVFMRTEPKRAIQILEHCWASHLTVQSPEYVQKGDYATRMEKATYVSKAMIDACVPLEWDPNWHGEIKIDPDVLKTAKEKFQASL